MRDSLEPVCSRALLFSSLETSQITSIPTLPRSLLFATVATMVATLNRKKDRYHHCIIVPYTAPRGAVLLRSFQEEVRMDHQLSRLPDGQYTCTLCKWTWRNEPRSQCMGVPL